MTISWLFSLLSIVFSSSIRISSADARNDFLKCLSSASDQTSVYTPTNTSYSSILHFSIQNLRFNSTQTPKPLVIITPASEYEIQQLILCAKETNMHVRIRSGGHDYEGLSYVSNEDSFILVDLINHRNITVNVEEKSAWVDAGSTNGELCYRIAEKSKTLGFPAGTHPSVGVSGYLSGGGYGVLQRKYGLGADNVVDARLVDANGRILDRESMGEDLFWAIRGGGGNTFGLVLSWKVKLVDVPEKVTVFTIDRTLEQNATKLVHKWQYLSPKLHPDLFIRILIRIGKSSEGRGNNKHLLASFNSMFLGGIDQLLLIMKESFPELGLAREDCIEMSWVESTLYFAGFPRGESLDVLISRGQPSSYYKAKSDYVQKPISESGLEGIWNLFHEDEAEFAQMILSPCGGRIGEISEHDIPFPHRAGNLYHIQHVVLWNNDQGGEEAEIRHISWIRKLYAFMAPFVSKFPRAAYINYRDLDIGMNNKKLGNTSYERAKVWGIKYFKNNVDRLVQVKTKVDPSNFFRNEQSIPPLTK